MSFKPHVEEEVPISLADDVATTPLVPSALEASQPSTALVHCCTPLSPMLAELPYDFFVEVRCAAHVQITDLLPILLEHPDAHLGRLALRQELENGTAALLRRGLGLVATPSGVYQRPPALVGHAAHRVVDPPSKRSVPALLRTYGRRLGVRPSAEVSHHSLRHSGSNLIAQGSRSPSTRAAMTTKAAPPAVASAAEVLLPQGGDVRPAGTPQRSAPARKLATPLRATRGGPDKDTDRRSLLTAKNALAALEEAKRRRRANASVAADLAAQCATPRTVAPSKRSSSHQSTERQSNKPRGGMDVPNLAVMMTVAQTAHPHALGELDADDAEPAPPLGPPSTLWVAPAAGGVQVRVGCQPDILAAEVPRFAFSACSASQLTQLNETTLHPPSQQAAPISHGVGATDSDTIEQGTEVRRITVVQQVGPQHVLVGFSDGAVSVYNAVTQELAVSRRAHSGAVLCAVAASTCAEHLVAKQTARPAVVPAAASVFGSEVAQPLRDRQTPEAAEESRIFLTSGGDGCCVIWNLEWMDRWLCLRNQHGEAAATALATTADGMTIFSGGADGSVRAWSIAEIPCNPPAATQPCAQQMSESCLSGSEPHDALCESDPTAPYRRTGSLQSNSGMAQTNGHRQEPSPCPTVPSFALRPSLGSRLLTRLKASASARRTTPTPARHEPSPAPRPATARCAKSGSDLVSRLQAPKKKKVVSRPRSAVPRKTCSHEGDDSLLALGSSSRAHEKQASSCHNSAHLTSARQENSLESDGSAFLQETVGCAGAMLSKRSSARSFPRGRAREGSEARSGRSPILVASQADAGERALDPRSRNATPRGGRSTGNAATRHVAPALNLSVPCLSGPAREPNRLSSVQGAIPEAQCGRVVSRRSGSRGGAVNVAVEGGVLDDAMQHGRAKPRREAFSLARSAAPIVEPSPQPLGCAPRMLEVPGAPVPSFERPQWLSGNVHAGAVTALCCVRHEFIVSAGVDGTITVSSVTTGRTLHACQPSVAAIYSLVYDPVQRALWASGAEGFVGLMDAASPELTLKARIPHYPEAAVCTVDMGHASLDRFALLQGPACEAPTDGSVSTANRTFGRSRRAMASHSPRAPNSTVTQATASFVHAFDSTFINRNYRAVGDGSGDEAAVLGELESLRTTMLAKAAELTDVQQSILEKLRNQGVPCVGLGEDLPTGNGKERGTVALTRLLQRSRCAASKIVSQTLLLSWAAQLFERAFQRWRRWAARRGCLRHPSFAHAVKVRELWATQDLRARCLSQLRDSAWRYRAARLSRTLAMIEDAGVPREWRPLPTVYRPQDCVRAETLAEVTQTSPDARLAPGEELICPATKGEGATVLFQRGGRRLSLNSDSGEYLSRDPSTCPSPMTLEAPLSGKRSGATVVCAVQKSPEVNAQVLNGAVEVTAPAGYVPHGENRESCLSAGYAARVMEVLDVNVNLRGRYFFAWMRVCASRIRQAHYDRTLARITARGTSPDRDGATASVPVSLYKAKSRAERAIQHHGALIVLQASARSRASRTVHIVRERYWRKWRDWIAQVREAERDAEWCAVEPLSSVLVLTGPMRRTYFRKWLHFTKHVGLVLQFEDEARILQREQELLSNLIRTPCTLRELQAERVRLADIVKSAAEEGARLQGERDAAAAAVRSAQFDRGLRLLANVEWGDPGVEATRSLSVEDGELSIEQLCVLLRVLRALISTLPRDSNDLVDRHAATMHLMTTGDAPRSKALSGAVKRSQHTTTRRFASGGRASGGPPHLSGGQRVPGGQNVRKPNSPLAGFGNGEATLWKFPSLTRYVTPARSRSPASLVSWSAGGGVSTAGANDPCPASTSDMLRDAEEAPEDGDIIRRSSDAERYVELQPCRVAGTAVAHSGTSSPVAPCPSRGEVCLKDEFNATARQLQDSLQAVAVEAQAATLVHGSVPGGRLPGEPPCPTDSSASAFAGSGLGLLSFIPPQSRRRLILLLESLILLHDAFVAHSDTPLELSGTMSTRGLPVAKPMQLGELCAPATAMQLLSSSTALVELVRPGFTRLQLQYAAAFDEAVQCSSGGENGIRSDAERRVPSNGRAESDSEVGVKSLARSFGSVASRASSRHRGSGCAAPRSTGEARHNGWRGISMHTSESGNAESPAMTALGVDSPGCRDRGRRRGGEAKDCSALDGSSDVLLDCSRLTLGDRMCAAAVRTPLSSERFCADRSDDLDEADARSSSPFSLPSPWRASAGRLSPAISVHSRGTGGATVSSSARPYLGFRVRVVPAPSAVDARPHDGKPPRGMLAVHELAATFTNSHGELQQGPALAAGVKVGDLLVRFAGYTVTDLAAFNAVAARHVKPSSGIPVVIQRNGEVFLCNIHVGLRIEDRPNSSP